ncbi:DNA-binding SARP family transcriptional activator/tetratricopeptide (TPR) repeat protein [Saccharothrix tamanrassetensis]|uniref:DNA-binding SARP family transcriptional activator/tetratricopeptide (TPR) repeat protein n=1 Tax=Saccharothrix tamanrassetensis TaxID=1051531 RepID=A0A841CUR6_9PSEU|nr:BTAD domain-containing putative transcriptional regulator [Saccharothrix tamanrassetensis]MBB5959767.1 DNA-binding SARP family transcriptional activator/tetratricopeptide (TPR) repeat protein [Saccharothrix tamanrassetensis]
MLFEVFGPTGLVSPGGNRTPIPARKPRVLLSTLLLHANEQVSVERLVRALWEDSPPASAVGNVKTYVWTLRRLLACGTTGDDGRIAADRNGYRIEVRRDEVDVFLFEDRVSEGCREWVDGEPGRAVEVLSRALPLWRGEPFPELTGAAVDAVRTRLAEQRLTGHEYLARALVASGRAAEAVAALSGLVAEHPFREHLRAVLMTALHRSGRPAEALSLYEDTRKVLDRELGVLPGAELRRLHVAILADDDVGDGTAGLSRRAQPVTTVAQLPTAPQGFVGRADVVHMMDRLLGDPGTDPVLCVVTGTAGVGKTALTLHWAHRVRSRFPGGQLFVDLRGHSAEAPLSAKQALDEVLHALGGGQADLPTSVGAAAAAYRSALADRPMLVVLDDAADVRQVRPLLPGSPGSAVVVTSRNRLDGLVAREGARQVRLDVLAPGDALDVLGGIVGPARLARERGPALELVALCGGLPLALRIAAAHLAARPDRSIGDYVTGLRTGDRLAALEPQGDPDSAVKAALDLSYAWQPADTQRLFRLLGLMPGPDTAAPAVAALAGVGTAEAERGLRALVAAHLVEEPAPGRYALHELLRLYAADRAAVDGRAPLDRLIGWYVATADQAADALDGGRHRLPHPAAEWGGPDPLSFADAGTALAWLTDEAANLAATVRSTAETGPRWAAWYIADAMKGFFVRGNTAQWSAVVDPALRAAVGNPMATAAMRNSAGVLGLTRGDHAAAVGHFTEALEAATVAGWNLGRTVALSNLGVLHLYNGPLTSALEYLDRADALATSDPTCLVHAGTIRLNLGAAAWLLARPAEAMDHLAGALTFQHESGHDRGRGMALLLLAETHLQVGDLKRAAHLAELASSHVRQHRIDHELAWCLEFRARLALLDGNHRRALDLLAEAAQLAEGHHFPETDTRNTTAVAYRLQHRLPEAAALHHRALEAANRSGYLRGQVEALLGLSAVCLDRGEPAEASTHASAALDHAHCGVLRTHEAQARAALAAAEGTAAGTRPAGAPLA